MREIPLHDSAGLPGAEAAALRGRVAAQPTLADVLRWAAAQSPPVSIAEIVTQDEYTHDVLIELEPRLCLVFDAI